VFKLQHRLNNLLPFSLPGNFSGEAQQQLFAEILAYMRSMSVKVDKGYQYGVRAHLMTHLSKDKDAGGVMNKVDSFVRPNIVRHGSTSHSCLLCKKVLKLPYTLVRLHFVALHLGS
jgi:hypothetical protein